jgi:hypothetical protein
VHADRLDVERPLLERGPFQYLDHRPDRVVTAEVVIQPELVQPLVPQAVQQFNSGGARPCHERVPPVDERAEIVDEHDHAGRCHVLSLS